MQLLVVFKAQILEIGRFRNWQESKITHFIQPYEAVSRKDERGDNFDTKGL